MYALRGPGLLGLLGRLFQPPGGVQPAPNTVDNTSPIQVVFDALRAAQLASAYGNPASPGDFLIGPVHNHVGSDDQYSSTDPRAVIRIGVGASLLPASDLDWDVWWLGAYSWSATASYLSAANLVAVMPALPGQTISTSCLLYVASAALVVADQAAAATDSAGVQVSTQTFTPPVNPIRLPPGTTLNARTAAPAGAGQIQIVSRVFAAPRGVLPPGLV